MSKQEKKPQEQPGRQTSMGPVPRRVTLLGPAIFVAVLFVITGLMFFIKTSRHVPVSLVSVNNTSGKALFRVPADRDFRRLQKASYFTIHTATNKAIRIKNDPAGISFTPNREMGISTALLGEPVTDPVGAHYRIALPSSSLFSRMMY